MQRNIVIILFSLGILFILFVILVFVLMGLPLKPNPDIERSAPPLEICKLLSYNSEQGLNVVFFSDKAMAEKYKNFFLEAGPYLEHESAFNFYYIDSYKPKCVLYEDIAIFCHSSELIKRAASCPNDYIVVIENKEPHIRSSSYLNVMSLNEKHPLSVFLHEFGHVFVTLAEEYVPASLSFGSKNCVRKCSDFEGLEEGCFQGCSKADYYRSIEAGVMRTLSSEKYGKFNEHLIIEKLSDEGFSSITGRNIDENKKCAEKNYYLLIGSYQNGSIVILDKTIEEGCAGGNGNGEFNGTFIGENGQAQQSFSFNPNLVYTDAPGVRGIIEINGSVFKYRGNFTLTLPILEDVKSLILQRDGKSIIEVSLYDIGARACRI